MDNPETTPTKPKRRPRYSGTHPRRFDQKYKELDPRKYPVAVAKIMASGKTPAGTHRPICVKEVLEVLQPKPGLIAVDVTLGYGGHAVEILKAITPGGRLLALDTDPVELPKTEARLRALGFGPEVLAVVQSNFAGLPKLLANYSSEGADMVLADLGCSAMQFDNPARGFSYKLEGPLDLRMNPNKGRPASDLLAALSKHELAALLTQNSDEPHASLLAERIDKARAVQPITTTIALTGIVRAALQSLPKQVRETEGDTPVRRVFQALRIAVNEEFTSLEMFLRFLPQCLKAGGRVAVLTFHSGEDRRVKKAFQSGHRNGVYSDVAQEVIRPSAEEIHGNPRASSAKLRWAIKAGNINLS
jgi:16S rRNA (cytosine1402-N4)-methyltransferase